MFRNILAIGLSAALFFAPVSGSAQQEMTATQQDAMMQIVKQVRHQLLSLTEYGVFDYLHFAIKGNTVILQGYASRPTLKSSAERAVKGIKGVGSVDNQIMVLPNSPNDDRIRGAVYQRIYTQPSLRKYTGSPVGFGRAPSVARAAGGITADPPSGYHAIHIIVNNGNVILKGVVDSEGDSNIAQMQANSAPGAFSVDNDLDISRPADKK